MNWELLMETLPNYGGTMTVNGKVQPYSHLEFSRPTGKYVAQIVMRMLNTLLEKHYVRLLGSACLPGVALADIQNQPGLNQFEKKDKSCGLIIANVLGSAKHHDAVVIPSEPFMVLKVKPNWTSFEAYKKEMTSKYRTRTNRVFVLSEQVEKRNLSEEGLGPWIEPCANLLFETLKHKTIAIGSNLPLLLQTFHQQLGMDYQVFGYFLNQKLIGFISYVKYGDKLCALHLGYDMESATPLHLYQRMMYDVIEKGIELGCKEVNLGRTAAEIKSTFGAEPVENSFVFYTRNALLKLSLGIYANRFYQPVHYVLRHPFKDEKLG